MNRVLVLVPFVIAACGSGPQLTSSPDLDIVATANNGTFISAAAIGKDVAYVSLSSQSAAPGFATLDFDKGTSTRSTWQATNVTQTGLDVKLSLAPDGVLFWALVGQPQSPTGAQMTPIEIYSSTQSGFATASSGLAPFANFSASGSGQTVVGLVTDTSGIYLAYTLPGTGATGTSPDSQQFPANQLNTAASAGAIGRIDRTSPSTTAPLPGSFHFSPGLNTRVLAQNATDLYWIDSAVQGTSAASIMHAKKSAFGSTAGSLLASVPQKGGTPLFVSGIEANDSFVVWSATPQPVVGATGCWIYASANGGAATAIFGSDTTPIDALCTGLAIDDTYAYVALARVSDLSNGGQSTSLLGTAIARVPLAGGAMKMIPLASTSWYGVRRVLVDDAFVYGVDPSFIARVPKTAFSP